MSATNQSLSCKKKQRSQEEQRKYYESWRASGLSKNAFCKQHKIAAGTFHAWCERYGHEAKEAYFAPVMSSVKTKPSLSESTTVEINFSNEWQLRVCLREDQLVGFLQELHHATTVIR